MIQAVRRRGFLNVVAVYESGGVKNSPSNGFIHTMCNLPNLNEVVSTTGMIDIMSRL